MNIFKKKSSEDSTYMPNFQHYSETKLSVPHNHAKLHDKILDCIIAYLSVSKPYAKLIRESEISLLLLIEDRGSVSPQHLMQNTDIVLETLPLVEEGYLTVDQTLIVTNYNVEDDQGHYHMVHLREGFNMKYQELDIPSPLEASLSNEFRSRLDRFYTESLINKDENNVVDEDYVI